jgi:deoxyribodipyrimidine photo-lyase
MTFPTDYAAITARMQQVDPVQYGATRNFLDGAVTRLSPYISRGLISTRQVYETVLEAGYAPQQIEKFTQELAWRDYWQQFWMAHGERINNDLRRQQPLAHREGMPEHIISHRTGIQAIDSGIAEFYETGYLHNHLRMYIASLACNVGKCHWKVPAQWMYYHLLDADWASNALSWQWVCGANSHKLYYANQENINRYCYTQQRGTFLDVSYETLAQLDIPDVLQDVTRPEFITPLPQTPPPDLDPALPTLIHNFYNLDPIWRSDVAANRVLLLEPSVFEKYPISQKSIDFCISLAKENIPHVQLMVGEFAELKRLVNAEIYFKEHPLNVYEGIEDTRTWMTSVCGDFPSFFAFWKKCKKELM